MRFFLTDGAVLLVSPLAASGTTSQIIGQPLYNTAAVALMVGLTTAAGLGLRVRIARFGSLRSQILVIALASLAIGALAAAMLARLMVLDGDELRAVLVVMVLIVPFVALLVVLVTDPLRRDAARIESTLHELESGRHQARAGLDRSDEFGRVARSLDALGAELESVETRRRDIERERVRLEAERRFLLSSISHDLRSPISALQAAVEALIDGVAPDPDRYLRSMGRDLEALSLLVDDLFLLSRLEAGLVHFAQEWLDLGELVDETAEALEPLARTRRVSIEPRSRQPVPVRGNPAALGRVLRNLVDNAIRHTPTGSTVRITVEPGARATVRVIDDGPGFPPEFIPQAFDQFARAEPSRSRTSGGVGLGLAIAKGLIEAHGGRISIEQAPNGLVTVELPMANPPAAQPEDRQRWTSGAMT